MSIILTPRRLSPWAATAGAVVAVIVVWAMIYYGDDSPPTRSLFRVASIFVPAATVGGLAGNWVGARRARR